MSEQPKPEDIFCPACGYYCLGRGGVGCIDKPSMIEPKPAPQEPSAEDDARCPACDDNNFCGHPFHGVDALREENARLRTALDTLPGVTAQLRHAYAQVHGGRVSRRGMRQFADGLLAPQIRKLESACLQQSISNQPSADTIASVRALYRDDRDAMAAALIQMRADLAEAQRER